MAQKKNKKQASQVLADHKQVGKRFVPPFLHLLGDIEFVRWQKETVPELLWIALLIEEHGLRRAAEHAVALARAAVAARQSLQREWFGAASAYLLLTQTQQSAVVEKLRTTSSLGGLLTALDPLVRFYPECPLGFLFGDGLPSPSGDGPLQALKVTLGKLFDKYSDLGTFTQAHAVYIAFVTDMLTVAPHLSLAQFPAIGDYPRTELSKRVAAAVRTVVPALMKNAKSSARWVGYFWNRGFSLEGCELGGSFIE